MTTGDNQQSSKNSWVIGSTADCDIVVDHPGVSKKHCRLRREGTTFTLEDLASTNGTFVNDVRVVRPVDVKPTDLVRLGGVVEMPWPKPTPVASPEQLTGAAPPLDDPPRRVIAIGALPDNDFVVQDATVSGHHAQLMLQGETWVLEDLGSTNGTFLKSSKDRVTKTIVRRSDVVFFGTKKLTISQCIAQAASGSPRGRSRANGSSTTKARTIPAGNHAGTTSRSETQLWLMYSLAALIPVVIIGGYQLLGSSGGSVGSGETVDVDPIGETAEFDSSILIDQSDSMPDNQGSQASKNTIPTIVSNTGNSEETSAEELKRESERIASTRAPGEQSVNDAVFILTVESIAKSPETQTSHYRIGTGWTVRNDLLITTAHTVEIIENQVDRSLFPNTVAFSATDGKPSEVDGTGMSPSYAEAKKRFDTAAALVGRLEKTTGIGTEEVNVPEGTDIDAIAEQYQQAYRDASIAYQVMKANNVGWIRLTTKIPNPMLVEVSKSSRLRPKQSIELVGAAFDADDPYLDSLAFRVSRDKGVMATPQAFESAGAIQNLWIVDSPSDWTAINADGCLVVDPRAPTTAIGMFSKAIPGPADGSEQGYAMVEANVIANLLNEI